MARRALRVCPCTGCTAHPGSCPALTRGGRCTPCAQVADRARGTRQARGYDAAHDTLRRELAPAAERGEVDCARCGLRILAGEPWALDHNDDRTGYLGPSHQRCNATAAGKAAHRYTQ